MQAPRIDPQAIAAFLSAKWDQDIVPQLVDYIRIPNKSPMFDKDWQSAGHMDAAVALMEQWARAGGTGIGAGQGSRTGRGCRQAGGAPLSGRAATPVPAGTRAAASRRQGARPTPGPAWSGAHRCGQGARRRRVFGPARPPAWGTMAAWSTAMPW